MAVNRTSIPNLLSKDYDKIFLDNFQALPNTYKEIFNIVPSNTQYNKFSALTGLGLVPEKTEGNAFTLDEPKQKYSKTFQAVSYALGVRITREALDDDLSGHLRRIPVMLAQSAAATLETHAAQVFDRSQNVAYPGPDGKPLCADDHPLYGAGGGTFANKPATNVDLSVAAVEQAIAAMRTTPNDQGVAMGLVPKYLLVAPSNWAVALQLTQNPQQYGTSDRNINAIKTLNIIPIVWEYLTDADSWYLLTEKQFHQLMMVIREKVNTFSYSPTDGTLDVVYGVKFREDVGWVSAAGVYGSIGA